MNQQFYDYFSIHTGDQLTIRVQGTIVKFYMKLKFITNYNENKI